MNIKGQVTVKGSINFTYLLLICSVAALGGLLFGFDTAVISGTIGLFKREFNLSSTLVGWVASSAIVGCFIGALSAGFLSDRYGRKRILILSAICFFISAIWALKVSSSAELVLARLVGGMGIGIASVVSPLYIAEISPPLLRGRLVSLQQFAIVTGILVAFFSNSFIMNTPLPDKFKWRYMFGMGAVPSIMFLLFLLPVPESPRWLLKKGLKIKALDILTKINGNVQAETDMAHIADTLIHEESSLKALFKPGIRLALFIGIVLAFFTQVTGINAIMYYAPEIFKNAGATATTAFGDTVWIGLINLVFTLIAMSIVDRFGRKPLLLMGIMGMALALFYTGYAFYTKKLGLNLLLPVLIYVASFSMSFGVVGWVIFSEIFPTKIRGRAMSIVTGVVWSTCFLVSQTFPILIQKIGSAKVFWGYAILSILAFIFVLNSVPETKAKSLEEIEKRWEQ